MSSEGSRPGKPPKPGARESSSRKRADAKKPVSGTAGSGKGAGRKSAPAKPGSGKARPPRAASRGRRASGREFSAGGVVVRGEKVAVIVPTRRAADGSKVLALPKGHADPGETPVQAAEREVREETGVVAEPVSQLGETRYWYRRDGKTIGKAVSFFLFSYVEGDITDHDDEVEEVRWITLKQARKQLSHAAERDIVGLAQEYLLKDR